MLSKLIEIRDGVVAAYQKIRLIINPAVKFFVAWYIFAFINSEIGYDTRFSGGLIVILLSALCAFLPPSVTVCLAMLISLAHVYSISRFLALIMLMLFLILYILLLRFTPKQAIISVLIPVLAKHNLQYAVPMVAGSVYNPLMILPCVCGVAIQYFFDIVKRAASREVTASLDDIIGFFTDVMDAFLQNKAMYVTMIVFAVVIVVIFVIRKMTFEYSLPISIGAGIVANIICFLIAELKVGTVVKIGTLILMSLVGGIIAYICEFMKRVLDYTAIERLQFEDDDYYYYVKAVPKVHSRLAARTSGGVSEEEDEDESDEEYETEELSEEETEDISLEDDYEYETSEETKTELASGKKADEARSITGIGNRLAGLMEGMTHRNSINAPGSYSRSRGYDANETENYEDGNVLEYEEEYEEYEEPLELEDLIEFERNEADNK